MRGGTLAKEKNTSLFAQRQCMLVEVHFQKKRKNLQSPVIAFAGAVAVAGAVTS